MRRPRARRTTLPWVVTLIVLMFGSPAAAQAEDAGSEAPAAEKADAEQGRVEIEGLTDALREAVRPALDIVRERDHPSLSPARLELLHRRAPGQITKALEAFGYYQARVEARLDEKDGSHWTAHYTVDTGPRVLMGKVDVQLLGPGADDPVLQAAVAAFPLKTGQPLVHSVYEQGKAALLRTAADYGYFDARLTESRVEVDLERERADLDVRLQTGPRLRFGQVHIGETVVDGAFLRRYLPFQPGEPFEEKKLLQFSRALTDSGIFSDVRVTPRREPADADEVQVDVALKARPRNSYSAGLGYGTDTGPRLRLGWESRYMTRSGHRANVGLSASTIKRTLTGRYLIPGQDPLTENWSLRATLEDETTDTLDSRRARLDGEHTGLRWGWQETLGVALQVERSDIGDTGSNTAKLLLPHASWRRIWSDGSLVPERGLRVGMNVQGASRVLASDVTFLQARLDAKAVHSVPLGGRVLARVDAGTSVVSDFTELPASFRFFAGGDASLRGFDYQSLGPRDSAGRVIGGLHLLVGSLEYEHPVTESWRVAAFVDAGNAFDDRLTDIACGTGVGVRWVSPIGMVRVDLAAAISEADTPLRLHLVIGPDL